MSLSQNLPVYPPWHVQPLYTNLLSVLTVSPSSGGTHWPPWLQAHMLIVGPQVALAPLSSVATNDRLNYNKKKRLLWVVFNLFSLDLSQILKFPPNKFEFWFARSSKEIVNQFYIIVQRHWKVDCHRVTVWLKYSNFYYQFFLVFFFILNY